MLMRTLLGRRTALTAVGASRRWLSSEPVKVTASMVKELRDRTGSPMMDCKKALSDPEVNGDVEKGIEWLRKQGVAMAAKKIDRAMNDGLIGLLCNRKSGIIVEVSSETDFVARNDVFQSFVHEVCSAGLDKEQGDVKEDLLTTKTANHPTVKEALMQCTAVIAENVALKHAHVVKVENGVVGSYVHQKRGEHAGTQAGLVAVEADKPIETAEQMEALATFADSLAMHLVAAQAKFLDSIPSSVIENEKSIEMERLMKEAMDKAESDNKEIDQQVLEKRASKKVEKIIKKMKEEEIFLDQQLITADPSLSGKVSKALVSMGKTVGANLSVPLAVRLQVGAENQTVLKK